MADREAVERARELRAIIELGMDCEQFLDGTLGKRLIEDTDVEIATMKTRAVEVDTDTPAGLEEHRQIRLRVQVLYHWQQLFATYIKAGHDARSEFEQGEITGEEPLDDAT